jgi:putative transposase
MQPYRMMLTRCGVTQSMSRKGICFDSAVIESFFGTLKTEYFHLVAIEGIEALGAGVNDYIYYCNNQSIKLALQGLSPVD